MAQQPGTALTPEVAAMIGVEGDVVECWGVVDAEYLRRFTQAVMDPDPRYWDPDFANSTRYGEIITPPIMVSYMQGRLPPSPLFRRRPHHPRLPGRPPVRRHRRRRPARRTAPHTHRPHAHPQRRQRTGTIPIPQHRR